jgi:hypothetical protein
MLGWWLLEPQSATEWFALVWVTINMPAEVHGCRLIIISSILAWLVRLLLGDYLNRDVLFSGSW